MNSLIESANAAADLWWPWMVSASWQSAVVAGLLLSIVAFGRRWTSPIKYCLLLIALAKFAVPPLWSTPTGLFSQLGPQVSEMNVQDGREDSMPTDVRGNENSLDERIVTADTKPSGDAISEPGDISGNPNESVQDAHSVEPVAIADRATDHR